MEKMSETADKKKGWLKWAVFRVDVEERSDKSEEDAGSREEDQEKSKRKSQKQQEKQEKKRKKKLKKKLLKVME